MKHIFFAIGLTITAINLTAVPSQEELERTITGVHTRIFGAGGFYKEALDTRDWEDIIDITYDFVKAHALYNRSLINTYKKIKAANDELLREIRLAYSTLFSKQVKTIDIDTRIARASATFKKIEQQMTEIQTNLTQKINDEKFLLHGQEKVAQVLKRLALSIKTTALLARNELQK